MKHSLPGFRIAVVGGGAVGGYYGARLAQFGRDVHFLVRGGIDQIRRSGIRVIDGKESFRLARVNAYGAAEEIGACDLVLVALKTTSNGELPRIIPPLLHERTMLLSFQNGLGNEDFLAAHFGAERVLGGVCSVCLNRTAPGVIECYDRGYVGLGEFTGVPQPRTHDVAWELKRCGIVCRVVQNLIGERWRKLVWNIPFNGLAIAAGGVHTGQILASEPLRRAALGLMEEVIAAANRCGYPLEPALALEQIKRTEQMGAYKPSSLVDWEARRPLELEAIWGEPLRRAEAAGANAPRLEQLYATLHSLNARLA